VIDTFSHFFDGALSNHSMSLLPDLGNSSRSSFLVSVSACLTSLGRQRRMNFPPAAIINRPPRNKHGQKVLKTDAPRFWCGQVVDGGPQRPAGEPAC
jgi:hypothetical protein